MNFTPSITGYYLTHLVSHIPAEGSPDTGNGLPFMAFACLLVGVLLLFASGLVIYNILKISAAKRIKVYGTLRAMGGERGQSVHNEIIYLYGQQDKSDLFAGTASFVKNPMPFSIGGGEVPHTTISLNDTLIFSGIRMRVGGNADYPVMINNAGYRNGAQVIAANSVYNAVVCSHTFSEICPILKERADAKTFES